MTYTPSLVAAWAELRAHLNPNCHMDRNWCITHQDKGRDGKCSTGHAIHDMDTAVTHHQHTTST